MKNETKSRPNAYEGERRKMLKRKLLGRKKPSKLTKMQQYMLQRNPFSMLRESLSIKVS